LDWNQDGDLDAACANFSSNDVSIFINDGAGNLTAMAAFPTLSSLTTGIVAGDFDGDGYVDLLASSFLAPNLAFARNNSGQGFLPAVAQSSGTHLQAIAAADFDRDGALDVVICDAANNSTSVLSNNGAASFALAASWAGAGVPNDVAAGDLDGDFLPDVASSLGSAGSASVALNAHPNPVLGDFGRGTITQGSQQFVDTLFVDGSSGGAARRVEIAGGGTSFLSVSAPPLAAPGRPFAIWAMVGTPSASTVTPVPLLGAGLACLRPFHLFPTDATLAVLVNGFYADPFAIFPMAPAPSMELIPIPMGPGYVTLQGLMETAPGVLRLTNGIIVKLL
jgi:hypothetical protein